MTTTKPQPILCAGSATQPACKHYQRNGPPENSHGDLCTHPELQPPPDVVRGMPMRAFCGVERAGKCGRPANYYEAIDGSPRPRQPGDIPF